MAHRPPVKLVKNRFKGPSQLSDQNPKVKLSTPASELRYVGGDPSSSGVLSLMTRGSTTTWKIRPTPNPGRLKRESRTLYPGGRARSCETRSLHLVRTCFVRGALPCVTPPGKTSLPISITSRERPSGHKVATDLAWFW